MTVSGITVDGGHGRVYNTSAFEIEVTEKAWRGRVPADNRMRVPLPPLHRELPEMVTVLHFTEAYGLTSS